MNVNGHKTLRIAVILAIVAVTLLVSGASAASEFAPWSVQTVANAGDVGQYSALAISATGNPSISFYDKTYGDLKYATWNGTQWVITTVDASKRDGGWWWGWGNRWGQDPVYVKCYHGTERVGEHSSLALDSSGRPRISYYDKSRGDLKYASWDGAQWIITTVDSPGNVGEYSSLALDSSGKPRISYYDSTHGDLKYASWDGSRWIITTVDYSKRDSHGRSFWDWDNDGDYDKGYQNYYHGTGKVGEFSSLALDSSGKPRISYYDESNRDLKYASWNGNQWEITTVDGTNYKKGTQKGCNWDDDRHGFQYNTIKVGEYTSLALNTTGYPSISYYDETNRDLKYASWDGSRWVISTVDRAGSVGEYSSLELDSSGSPRISYYDDSSDVLKFASWSRTLAKWNIETVDNSKKVGTFTSLALDASGIPRISYYDQQNHDLKYTSGYSLNTPTLPTVSGLSPSTGPASGGTPVTITGTGFTGATMVRFGAAAGTSLTIISPTKITVISPSGTGTVNVTVTTPGGTSIASTASQFTYIAAPELPTITGISPSSGPTEGGTTVIITGTGFTEDATVLFGTSAATMVTFVSETNITAVAPSAATAGTVDVSVTTPAGTSVTSPAGKFTYIIVTIPLNVTGMNPSSGVAGETLSGVTITGKGFVTGTTPSVWLAKNGEDNINATEVVVLSPTQMSCTIQLTPYISTLPGKWDLYVANADGQTATRTAAFTMTNPPPTITSIVPSSGQNGTVIDIIKVTGTNFGFGSNPKIWLTKSGQGNITASDIHIYGTTQLSFRLNIPDSAEAGNWDLWVQSEDGQTGAYLGMFTVTYKEPSTMTVDWSQNGWDGWEHTASWSGTETGPCSIVGPSIENGHGLYGTDVSLARRGSTQLVVSKTFTAADGEKWSHLSFTGLLSSSDLPSGRSMTVNVNGVNVYSGTAAADSSINGQPFTLAGSFDPANSVTVTITAKQDPTLATSLYTLQFDSMTLS
jgi:hypothetical protein